MIVQPNHGVSSLRDRTRIVVHRADEEHISLLMPNVYDLFVRQFCDDGDAAARARGAHGVAVWRPCRGNELLGRDALNHALELATGEGNS